MMVKLMARRFMRKSNKYTLLACEFSFILWWINTTFTVQLICPLNLTIPVTQIYSRWASPGLTPPCCGSLTQHGIGLAEVNTLIICTWYQRQRDGTSPGAWRQFVISEDLSQNCPEDPPDNEDNNRDPVFSTEDKLKRRTVKELRERNHGGFGWGRWSQNGRWTYLKSSWANSKIRSNITTEIKIF